jgi:transposase
MVQLGELMMILELHRQGLTITAIARRTGRDPKTVRKYVERGIEAPVYGPRSVGRPSKLAPFMGFLRERVTAFPDLSAARLTREVREFGYAGAYTAVKRFLAAIRPENGPKPYEVRFETPPGVQAQVDFARFVVDFTDDPGTSRVVWLFSLVLGHSRFLFARYVLHQDLQTLLRCHIQAFEAIGGVPIEILYDRMKTAVTGEDDQGHIAYNRSLLALAQHYRWPSIIASSRAPAGPTGRRRRGKSSGRSAISVRTSFSAVAFAASTTSTPSSSTGSIPSPIYAFTAPPNGSSPRRSPPSRPLPQHRFDAVLKLERRVSHDGFVAIGGNFYSVPDRARRVVEVQQLADLIRILDLGNIVAEHPILEGRKQYRIDRRHRTGGSSKRKTNTPSGIIIGRIGDHVPLRPLAIYQAIGAQLANAGRP